MRVVHATRGTECGGPRKLRIRAAHDVYARTERKTKLHREERDATTDARDKDVMSPRDAGVHNRGPAQAYVSVGLSYVGILCARADGVPPSGDACDRPGGCMHVIEMCGRANDLFPRDGDVCGEGADGRVIPTSQETKPSSVVRVHKGLRYRRRPSLRAFGGEWVTLPSARWNKEDAFVY